MKIKRFIIAGLLMVGACNPVLAQTTVTTLGATDRVDRTVLNANFNNLKQSVDGFHPSTTNHSSHNLDLWSNSVVTVSNVIGIGSGIITNFREIYADTIAVSKIVVGTGSVSVADAANWNSNYTWYIDYSTNLFYRYSNNICFGTNTFTTNTYMKDLYLYGTNATDWVFASITNGSTNALQWGSNYTWYLNYVTSLGYLSSNQTWSGANNWSGTNTFATNLYAYRVIRIGTNHTYQDHELVDYDTVVDLVGNLIGNVMFGSTNKHPVITANRSMVATLPDSWITTNVLAEGTNLLGTYYWTNAVVSFVPKGAYIGHFHSQLSADKDTESWIHLICSDGGATTNLIQPSDRVTLSTTLGSHDVSAYVDTNHFYAGQYLGVRYYANKKTAQAANLITYGGTNYSTQLSTPSLSGGIDQTLYIKKDGSVAWTGSDNRGGQKGTNAADGVISNDLATLWNVWAVTNNVYTNIVAGNRISMATTGQNAYVSSATLKASVSLFPITTNAAPDNYTIAGPIPYASTVTNLLIFGDGGTYIGDLFTCARTNPTTGRTLIYTGVTYTVGTGASNFPMATSVAADKWYGFVITNGPSPTNAGASVEFTY